MLRSRIRWRPTFTSPLELVMTVWSNDITLRRACPGIRILGSGSASFTMLAPRIGMSVEQNHGYFCILVPASRRHLCALDGGCVRAVLAPVGLCGLMCKNEADGEKVVMRSSHRTWPPLLTTLYILRISKPHNNHPFAFNRIRHLALLAPIISLSRTPAILLDATNSIIPSQGHQETICETPSPCRDRVGWHNFAMRGVPANR